jgi:hypothetical protein
MKPSVPPHFPPHVSMDVYVAYVEESFRAQNPKQIRRQKYLEERIEKAFDMATFAPLSSPPRPCSTTLITSPPQISPDSPGIRQGPMQK